MIIESLKKTFNFYKKALLGFTLIGMYAVWATHTHNIHVHPVLLGAFSGALGGLLGLFIRDYIRNLNLNISVLYRACIEVLMVCIVLWIVTGIYFYATDDIASLYNFSYSLVKSMVIWTAWHCMITLSQATTL